MLNECDVCCGSGFVIRSDKVQDACMRCTIKAERDYQKIKEEGVIKKPLYTLETLARLMARR